MVNFVLITRHSVSYVRNILKYVLPVVLFFKTFNFVENNTSNFTFLLNIVSYMWIISIIYISMEMTI